MKIGKTSKQFISIVLIAAMMVTISPFVPQIFGVDSAAANKSVVYAGDSAGSADDAYEAYLLKHAEELEKPLTFCLTDDGNIPEDYGYIARLYLYNFNTQNKIELQYRIGDSEWVDWVDSNTQYTQGSEGRYVCLQLPNEQRNEPISVRAKSTNSVFSTDRGNFYSFYFNPEITYIGPDEMNREICAQHLSLTVSGNVMSLVSKDNYVILSKSENEAPCFAYLFKDMKLNTDFEHYKSVEIRPLLPSKNLSDECYYSMFCEMHLTVGPELPATNLAKGCYRDMFYNCTTLTKAPELPATTLAESCYMMMFSGCSALTEAPELPATNLAKNCYMGMFQECSALAEAPALPATDLEEACYQNMFTTCTSLKKAPELPATKLANDCYMMMFAGCYALAEAPALPATNLAEACYYGMFGVCTSLEKAPALPATNLAKACYQVMFMMCTSLEKAPALPATTLVDACYAGMFMNCSSLNKIEVSFTDWYEDESMEKSLATTSNMETGVDEQGSPIYADSLWLSGVSNNGTFICPKDLDTNKTGAGYIPEGWTTEQAKPDTSGWNIIFSDSAVMVTGLNETPENVVVKGSDGAENGMIVPSTVEGKIITFNSASDIYEIKFEIAGVAYSMHANCKTKDIEYTTDTRYLENAIGEINVIKEVSVSEGSVPMMVTEGLEAGIVAQKSSIETFSAAVPGTDYDPSTLADQVTVDADAMNYKKVYNAYLSSLNAPLLTVSDGNVVAINYGENVKGISISYAEGIYASKANAVSTEEFGNSLTPEANKVYTFFTQADICGNTKSFVVYYGSAADLLAWANGHLAADKKIGDLDNAEDVIAAYLDAIKPEPSGSGTHGTTPVNYLEKGIDELVSFAVDKTVGSISWESNAPSVVIERVAYARGNVKDVQDAKYIPLCEGDTDFYTLAEEDYTIKMLLRSGDEIKTFYKVVSADEITAVNTPAVEVYSGAIAAYGRGCNPASIAYVKGSFDTLAEAKAAELAEGNPVKVYYIKEGAKLDSTSFKGDFTFFFGETPLEVHFN